MRISQGTHTHWPRQLSRRGYISRSSLVRRIWLGVTVQAAQEVHRSGESQPEAGKRGEATNPSFITLAIMSWKSTAEHAISGGGVATSPAGANRLTASKPRPERTRSVVAATLPPFRCRSHMISRVLNCGNIWDICSTWAGSTTLPRARPRALGGLLSSSRLKNHRITKKETTARVRSEGMLRDGSSSGIVADR